MTSERRRKKAAGNLYYKLEKGVERPIVRIKVSNGGKAVYYYGLIDSGADMNLFHSEISDLLGITLETGVKGYMKGAVEGRPQVYYIHPIVLEVEGRSYGTYAAFMTNLSKNGHGLLGQRTFFNLFNKVSFGFTKKEIELVEK